VEKRSIFRGKGIVSTEISVLSLEQDTKAKRVKRIPIRYI
jgi:hypothetical protein